IEIYSKKFIATHSVTHSAAIFYMYYPFKNRHIKKTLIKQGLFNSSRAPLPTGKSILLVTAHIQP
ncbi:hypothetical protein, partial [Aeromonas allosaccharophila]|uniref:hypothetical protein n=1 Tax=Aeromonas allosaccharophila TaxID=656 RepID=UPI003D2265C3